MWILNHSLVIRVDLASCSQQNWPTTCYEGAMLTSHHNKWGILWTVVQCPVLLYSEGLLFKSSSLIIHSQIPLKTPTECAEMVEKTAKRGPFVAVLFMFVILLHLNYCGAAASLNINTTTSSSSLDGPVDDSEFMFDSQISRMLVNYEFVHGTDGSRSRNKVFCSRKPYKNCLPQGNGQRVPETCDKYKRKGC